MKKIAGEEWWYYTNDQSWSNRNTIILYLCTQSHRFNTYKQISTIIRNREIYDLDGSVKNFITNRVSRHKRSTIYAKSNKK